MSRSFGWASLAFVSVLVLATAASAAPNSGSPNWEAVSEVGVVRVITQDEDGDPRNKKIWFVVMDGQGFIRSGGSQWVGNLKRDPNLILDIEGQAYELRADFIEDPELRARITAAFREKYGFSDNLATVLRGSNPSILHMIPR